MRTGLPMLLQAAQAGGFAVPCFNVFGFEDARAVVDEAVSRNAPVILATNREMLEFTGLGATCAMLNALADEVLTPVCVHLDHCYDVELACQAVDAGFGSVMYDGSQLDFDVNVANTRRVVDYAHAAGIGVEGEIGSVAYNASDNRGREHIRHELTEPETAARFAELSGADAVAVSSTSGITDAELKRLTRGAITKCNIGTSLRQCFGRALRETLAQDPDEFDRLTIFRGVMPHMRAEAGRYFDLLGANGTATHLLEKIA